MFVEFVVEKFEFGVEVYGVVFKLDDEIFVGVVVNGERGVEVFGVEVLKLEVVEYGFE